MRSENIWRDFGETLGRDVSIKRFPFKRRVRIRSFLRRVGERRIPIIRDGIPLTFGVPVIRFEPAKIRRVPARKQSFRPVM